MKKLTVNQENIHYKEVTLYNEVDDLVYILLPRTIAQQVFMSDGVNIEDKLIGISADTYQASQTAVAAYQKANKITDTHKDIYISKSGSDSNTGFDKNHPVASFSHAIDLALSMIKNNDFVLNLYVGPGNWGDVTIQNTSCVINIYPSDGIATEYSEDLPIVNNLYIKHAYVSIYGLVIGKLVADNSSIVYAQAYKRFGRIEVNNNSYFVSSTSLGGVFEVDGARANGTFLNVFSSIAILDDQIVRLVSPRSTASYFASIYNSDFSINPESVWDYNDVEWPGGRIIADSRSRLLMGSGGTTHFKLVEHFLSKIFGTFDVLRWGTSFNNLPNNAVNKFGDVMSGGADNKHHK